MKYGFITQHKKTWPINLMCQVLGVSRCNYYSAMRREQALMKEAGVSVKRRKKYKVTTDSNHKQPLFDNVLTREFDVQQPDQTYVSDITYIWTQEGWLYLAVVIDLFSRKVMGWSMSSRMNAQLVCDALTMALWQRKPKMGLVHHSDRGSQYASKQFRKLLKTHQITGSMSRTAGYPAIHNDV